MTRVVRKSPFSGLKTGVHSSFCRNNYNFCSVLKVIYMAKNHRIFQPWKGDFLTTCVIFDWLAANTRSLDGMGSASMSLYIEKGLFHPLASGPALQMINIDHNIIILTFAIYVTWYLIIFWSIQSWSTSRISCCWNRYECWRNSTTNAWAISSIWWNIAQC